MRSEQGWHYDMLAEAWTIHGAIYTRQSIVYDPMPTSVGWPLSVTRRASDPNRASILARA